MLQSQIHVGTGFVCHLVPLDVQVRDLSVGVHLPIRTGVPPFRPGLPVGREVHVPHPREIPAPPQSPAERVPRAKLRVEGAVHLGQDEHLSPARELRVDDVHVVVFPSLPRLGAEVPLDAAEELLARHRQQQDGGDGHGELAGALAQVPEIGAEVVEPVGLLYVEASPIRSGRVVISFPSRI